MNSKADVAACQATGQRLRDLAAPALLVSELQQLRDASQLFALAIDDLRVELAFMYPGLAPEELDRLTCMALHLAIKSGEQSAG